VQENNISVTQIRSSRARSGILQDPSKGVGLLFGTLLILLIYGSAESLFMLGTGRPAGLPEIIIFALLAMDAIILMLVLRPAKNEGGWLGLLAVWVLGLIPYFGWVVIYAGGKWMAGIIQRRWRNLPLIAVLAWIVIVFACLSVYMLTSHGVQPQAPPA
jgi:hypothetical protein